MDPHIGSVVTLVLRQFTAPAHSADEFQLLRPELTQFIAELVADQLSEDDSGYL